jgi:hypothetical protein
MEFTPFEFNGKTYAFSFTAKALFDVYDKFGCSSDILASTKILDPSAEGWANCCWLAALMASEGELLRRRRGETPQPMLAMEELRSGLRAAESNRLRDAVVEALQQGFRRDIPSMTEDEEVDLVLQSREEAAKKARGAVVRGCLSLLSRLFDSTSAPKTH